MRSLSSRSENRGGSVDMSKPVLCESHTPTASLGTRSMRRSFIALASLSVSPTMICVDQMIPTCSGIASFGPQGRVHILALLGHERDRLAGAEDVVDEARRRACAARRAPGLDQHRVDLRRRRYAQRALHLEEAPDVIDRAYLGRIGDQAGLAVPFEGIRLHACPERPADIDELVHAVVALTMLHQLVEAVILRVRLALGGDHVERDAPVGEVIERVQEAGDVERVHEGRCIGQAEADMAGHPRHGRDPGAHIQARPGNAEANRVLDRTFPCVRNSGAVAEEDQVEQSALRDARNILEQADIGVMAADARAWFPPSRLDLRP